MFFFFALLLDLLLLFMLIFWLFLRFEPDLSWSTVVIDAGEMPRPRLIRNLGSSYKVVKSYVMSYIMKKYTILDFKATRILVLTYFIQ